MTVDNLNNIIMGTTTKPRKKRTKKKATVPTASVPVTGKVLTETEAKEAIKAIEDEVLAIKLLSEWGDFCKKYADRIKAANWRMSIKEREEVEAATEKYWGWGDDKKRELDDGFEKSVSLYNDQTNDYNRTTTKNYCIQQGILRTNSLCMQDCRAGEWYLIPVKIFARIILGIPVAKTVIDLGDIILDEATKEDIISAVKQIENQHKLFVEWGLGEVIEYGKGITLLFHGVAGTGKTLIARRLAKVLKFKMLELDTAQLESSEPGQYERNLTAFFQKAEKEKSTILFLDECDGLIQSRTGMGQIMSAQNNCLLKCIENYSGILIMATNRIDSLDEALERRISLIIEFKRPSKETRIELWKRHLPKKLPIDPVITPTDLAEFDLTGGQIKNVVLNAARFAIAADAKQLSPEHFARAVRHVNKGSEAFTSRRLTGHQQQDYVVKGG
jgi:AAA+ superfamily predicted ATPase